MDNKTATPTAHHDSNKPKKTPPQPKDFHLSAPEDGNPTLAPGEHSYFIHDE